MVLSLATLAVLAILMAALSTAVYRIPRRWACPKCHVATVPLKKRVGWLVSRWVEWRWCPRCHWHGLSRGGVGKAPPAPSGREIPPPDGFRWRGRRAPSPGGPSDAPMPTLQADHSAFAWGTQRSTPPFRWKGDAAGQTTAPGEVDEQPEGNRPRGTDSQPRATGASGPASPLDGHEQEADEDSDPFGFRWKE